MDLLGIVILVFIYSIAISSSAKKKKKKNMARKQAARTRTPRFEQAFAGDTQTAFPPQHSDAHDEREELQREPLTTQMQMELENAGEGDDPCHESELRPARVSMRLSNVSQEGMALAGEGEDPCHTGEAPRREANPVYDSPILSGASDDAQALKRQVLAGVIMSEVLKRPQERHMERKLRGRA